MNKNNQLNKKTSSITYMRIINMIGIVILSFLIFTDGIQHIGLMFFYAIYLWVFILFVILEIRSMNSTKNGLIEYFRADWFGIIVFFGSIIYVATIIVKYFPFKEF